MNRLKSILLVLGMIFLMPSLYAQYDTLHYIPPSRWSYFNDRHELVFSTLSDTPVQITIRRSDGTFVSNETVVKGTPTRFTFTGAATTDQRNQVTTVYTDQGLIISAPEAVSVNVRNVNGDTSDAILKGNTSLTSKGYLALGQEFHLIYYRDFGAFYGIMAVEDNTNITQNGTPLVTLQAGECYLIGGSTAVAALGDLIQSDKPISLTSSYDAESPGQCADPTADQLIPNAIAGEEHICVRGQGNPGLQIEFTTIMATEANTDITVNGTPNTTLVNPGDFVTISNGPNAFDVNLIEANRPVLVAQGAGQGCEHGMSIIPPLKCTGSRHIETKDFNGLDYSVFVLSKCTSVVPTLNDTDLAGGTAIPASNWTLFTFDNTAVTGDDIILDSETPMHVGILQDGGQFGGFAYFSGFSRTGVEVSATTSSGDSTVIEGCIPAQYVFTRESFCDQTDTILVNVSGAATEGTDYNTLPDTLFFTPGTDTLYLDIETVADGLPEGTEDILISIIADRNCDGILDTVSSALYINDYVPLSAVMDKGSIEMCVDYYCSAESDVEMATAIISGGLPPYNVYWSDGFDETITVAPFQSTNTFSALAGNVPYNDTTYYVEVFDVCGNQTLTSIYIENNCPVCAPNIITPNGDLVNDFFVIRNIEQYPEAVVTIYNRWGNVIMETNNYKNDWSGGDVVEGVYFYQVTMLGEFDIHGFFHIER